MELRKLSEAYLKAATFRNPLWIPGKVAFLPATWKTYGEELEKIVLKYKKLFPEYQPGDYKRLAKPPHPRYMPGKFTDAWGCVWSNDYEGLAGVVTESPLKDWKKLESFRPPDPEKVDDYGDPVNWDQRRRQVKRIHELGGIAFGYFIHGFFFMRLFYLRGFEELMLDMATGEEKVWILIKMVREYNLKLAKLWLKTGIDVIWFGDDLGTQESLMVSPKMFREYIKPFYKEIFGLFKDAGVHVYFHSDGRIVDILEDLIECGVTIVNPQIGPNTVEELEKFKGRICMDVDLDRQLFSTGTPKQIREHIHCVIEALKQDEGGLMAYAECSPEVPLENIEAVCATMSELCGPTAMKDFVQLQTATFLKSNGGD